MLLSGIHTLTLLDYPGHVACIVFTAGCNFRCGYCHNPEFVLPEKIKERMGDMIPEEKFFSFLETRKEKLEGVVISGGEPTIHPDLPEFIRKIKNMGFLVKLDTNGTNPKMLAQLLEEKLLDYIAMDAKASPERYNALAGTQNNFSDIQHSRDLILHSGVSHELRTTIVKGWHDEVELKKIIHWCEGTEKYTLQNFRPQKTLCPTWGKYSGFTAEELKKFKKLAEKFLKKVEVMG
ncbi:anaerobic ribonucleoside-triphosphate reductase activating protein [Candidatus Gracilibacteria bacterium]|nr:anaerobic ribonucleoside-triphosphate reductase activating protein [Candidatus Gracilibacteria bacterium]